MRNELHNLILYIFADGDEDKQFDMGIEFGNILVAKKLDWETKNHYNITVSVTDGIHVTLTTVSLCLYY